LIESTPRLALFCREYELNTPDKGDYLAFDATVIGFGFAGRTHVWVSREDLVAFESGLKVLDESLTGDAELVCGFGSTEYLRLRIAPYGHSGRLLVHAEFAVDGMRTEHHHRTSLEFIALPTALSDFRRSLGRVLSQRVLEEAVLSGEDA
jgi:hypothetical protein